MYATSFLDTTLNSVGVALSNLLGALPAIIGALLLLVVGWIIAGIIARVVQVLLDKIGLNKHTERVPGLSGFLSAAGLGTLSGLIAGIVMWFIRLIFLEAAAQALNLGVVTQILNQILLFLPRLVVALIIVIVGALLAQLAGRLVRATMEEAKLTNSGLLGGLVEWAIIAFAAIAALTEIGIAESLLNTLFAAVVGAVALAVALAFGLGGRDVAAEICRRWYSATQNTGERQ
jgi:hypothetical protein